MGSRVGLLIFLSISLLALDWYIYAAVANLRKKRGKKIPAWLVWAWFGFSLVLIAGVFVSIYLNIRLTLRAIILVAFFIITVSKFCMFPFLLIDDIRRLILWLSARFRKQEKKPVNKELAISRSDFLVKAGAGVAILPFTSLTYGIVSGAYDYRVKKQVLHLPNLPAAFDGITIGQISDIHSGSFYNKKAVQGGVEKLLGQKPDVIFFTGDLVNNLASEMMYYQDIFSKVKAPLGVYSVLGNHDYGDYYFGREPTAAKFKNFEDVKTTHKNMGWDLLLNEHRKLKIGNDEIAVIGVENWGAGRFVRHGRMDLATKGTGDVPVKLLLSHDPSHWRAQVLPEYQDIDAMFSGHTHGMQFGVRTKEWQWSPVKYIYNEWAGLYREGRQHLYVNVGYGFLGYPGRVGILPEITIFELKRSGSLS